MRYLIGVFRPSCKISRLFFTILAAVIPATLFGATVNCTNNSATDLGLIQAAVNAGGSTTVNGPCNVNGSINLTVNGTTLRGGTNAILTETTNGNQILNLAASSLTITGIDFEGGVWNADNPLTNLTLTNNKLANVTGGSYPNGGAFVSNGFHNSTITGNTFDNAFPGGYRSLDPPVGNPGDSFQPACWQDYQGLDATVISHNRFTRCANDGFHINPNGSIHSTNASEFSYNYCAQTHRACYEIQAFVSNFVVKGNVAITFNGKFWNSFAYSIASVGTNFTFINNLGSLNTPGCTAGVPDFLELFLSPSLIQGNVAQSLPEATLACGGGVGGPSWDFATDNLGNNSTTAANTLTFQNNVMCGNSTIIGISHEDSNQERNIVDQFNYRNASGCPVAALAASNVSAPVFTSAANQSFPSGGSGTWTTTQISALPVSNVSFYIDGSSSPIVFQELQDVNTNFTNDLKWQYHATFNTGTLANGTHTIQAVATDVLGATNSSTQTFTVGSGPSPAVSFSPTSVTFGSIAVGSPSSPSTITLTNVGSAVLNISGISITGTNAGDFSETSTCASTLAAAASCNIAVTFKPVAAGTRTANISVADNAIGSPQTVALTGSASSPAVSFSPTSVTFGSIAVGSASSPSTITFTNVGTVVLNISGISISGTNAGDFSETSTCASTLAAGASCNIVVTFTPLAAGPRTANVSVADNAIGSPQTVALTGGPPACSGIALNCDFNGGASSWNLSAGSLGSWVVDGSGPGGVNAAHVSVTSAVPPGSNIELYQDNLTYGANSITYSLTFKANATRAQQVNVLGIQSSSPYTSFGLAYAPVLAVGWNTYSTTFTVVNSPGAGMGRITFQMDNSANGDQIYITDVSLAQVSNPGSPLTINSVGYITHSTAQIIVSFTSPISGNAGFVGRTRAVVSPAACIGNTNGLMQPMEIGPTYSTESAPGLVLNMDIAGLMAGTTYNVCPELSTDGGSTWTSGVGTTFTTLPLPAVHPAIPVAPATFDPSYPDTTGFAAYTLASDCSDIGAAYTAAVSRQATQGTVISIPPGTVCGTATTGNFNFALKPVDVQTWHPSNVTVATSQIQLGGSPTLTEGQGIRFGRSYIALTSYPASTSCEFGQGLATGQVYYVHVVNSSTNTVTLKCSDGVTSMLFASQGTDNAQGFYWVPVNRALKPIIVRSAAPDSQLPPPGVDITPAWQSKMGIIQSAIGNLGVVGPAGAIVTMGSNDGNYELMISNIRIGPGIEITSVDSPEAHTSSDPTPWYTFVFTYPFDDNIVFDRVYFHPLGAPNRVNDGLFWDGFNNGIINSYFDNIEYFHAEYSGLTATKTSGNTFTVAAGIENMGSGNITVPGPRTVTLSGTGTGRVFVGLNMANANTFTVWLPSGVTAACSGFTCATAAATGTTNGSCNASDSWPKDSAGNTSAGQIACVDVSAGAITAVTNANASFSTHWGEGASWMIGGLGPGPYVFQGNFSSCAGLCWHHDDSGGAARLRGDYTYYRNYFETPFKYMYNPGNLTANPSSDGLGRYHRQPGEWKGGRRIRYEANVCDGNWVEIEASAGCVLLTSVNGMGISDVDIRNNTFMHGPGVTSFCFVTAGSNFPMPPACQRFRLQNNLAWDIGNPNYYAGTQALPPPGWLGEGPNATEDVIVDHNTIVGNVGTNPAVMWPFDLNTEGVSVTNNILYINSTNQGVAQDGGEPNIGGCPLLTGKALADCKFTPSYIWRNNLMIGNGQTPAAVAAAWPSLSNYFQSGTSSLSAVGWFNYQAPALVNGNPAFLDYHLKDVSHWSAGGAVGADIDALNAAQGLVTLAGAPASSITSSSAAVAYVAPDSGNCYVDYAAGDPAVMTAPNRVQDAGGARSRSVALTGLTSQTTYYYRVMCSGNYKKSQRTGEFRTN
ncbi:MAG TPA: choice-of-anchor D domain-containing protein [Bryobacteraceae bacterium]|jgi:hypothetical protein